jgi:hypothetical protein
MTGAEELARSNRFRRYGFLSGLVFAAIFSAYLLGAFNEYHGSGQLGYAGFENMLPYLAGITMTQDGEFWGAFQNIAGEEMALDKNGVSVRNLIGDGKLCSNYSVADITTQSADNPPIFKDSVNIRPKGMLAIRAQDCVKGDIGQIWNAEVAINYSTAAGVRRAEVGKIRSIYYQ